MMRSGIFHRAFLARHVLPRRQHPDVPKIVSGPLMVSAMIVKMVVVALANSAPGTRSITASRCSAPRAGFAPRRASGRSRRDAWAFGRLGARQIHSLRAFFYSFPCNEARPSNSNNKCCSGTKIFLYRGPRVQGVPAMDYRRRPAGQALPRQPDRSNALV